MAISKGRIQKLLVKYLKKTGRHKTLKEVLLDIKQKDKKSSKISLSFEILKAPKIISIDVPKNPERKKKSADKKKIKKNKGEYNSSVILTANLVSPEFKLMATKFGLPKEHLEFFFDNREFFHWEMKENRIIHCSEAYCNFTTKLEKNGLVKHMVEVHNYQDIPCGEEDCKFVAYSHKSIKSHYSRFHGTGNRAPTIDPKYSCKYKSCSYQCKDTYGLELHSRIHENRLVSCAFCPYRSTTSEKMISQHLLTHFDTKNIKCELCSLLFRTQDALNRHWIRNHTKDFTCSYCSTSFPNFTQLQRHTTTCAERLKRLER